jgi:hypothetical protein
MRFGRSQQANGLAASLAGIKVCCKSLALFLRELMVYIAKDIFMRKLA